MTTRKSLCLWVLSFAAACVTGCSALSDFDVQSFGPGGADDGGAARSSDAGDAGGDGGAGGAGGTSGAGGTAGAVSESQPWGVAETGGGGETRSAGFTLKVRIGAPGPMGTCKSEHFTIHLGPGAGRR
jgi:hypothetical protein